MMSMPNPRPLRANFGDGRTQQQDQPALTFFTALGANWMSDVQVAAGKGRPAPDNTRQGRRKPS